ncbi:hypothetical protein BZG17_35040, partial [Escherichia coli]|nr:hypothetical protein [Escherichia coli]
IVAQEYYCPHCKSHNYKEVTTKDLELCNKASKDYELLQESLPIPFQEIPIGYNTQQMLNHGYVTFKDMFTQTQLLCLGLLLKEIESLKDEDVKYWLLLAFSA